MSDVERRCGAEVIKATVRFVQVMPGRDELPIIRESSQALESGVGSESDGFAQSNHYFFFLS